MTETTMLLRQIHPVFVVADKATSQAFRPTPKDAGRLSVYDGDSITPEKAWAHYTTVLGLQSSGTMGILVRECATSKLLTLADPAPFAEHCLIDFTALSKPEWETATKLLKRFANDRGWLHR